MNCNIVEKAMRVVKSCGEAYIGVIDENGYPSVSTVSALDPEGIFEAWFSTGMTANKTKRLLKNHRASVCYRKDGDNVTLVGDAEVLTDQETKSRFWRDWFIEHFPLDETDPDYCVIKFTTKRVSLWVGGESGEFTVNDLLTVQSRCGLLCKGCTYKQSHGCEGCVSIPNPFWGECPIKTCCEGKGLLHCGECSDMPCEQLNGFSCGDSEHCDKPAGARLNILRYWKK